SSSSSSAGSRPGRRPSSATWAAPTSSPHRRAQACPWPRSTRARSRTSSAMSERLVVIADAGPIIALGIAGQLDTLGQLFGRVVLPEAVYIEVVAQGRGRPGSSELLARSASKEREPARGRGAGLRVGRTGVSDPKRRGSRTPLRVVIASRHGDRTPRQDGR